MPICQMKPWWHVYLFWGMSYSSFCKGYFLTISAQTGSSWFLLILQTAKLSTKKESCSYAFKDWLVENLFSLGFHNGCLAEGHTEADMCVKWWCKNFYLRICNMHRFFKHWQIVPRFKFWLFLVEFLNINPRYMLCIPKSSYNLRKYFLDFSSTF